MTGRPEPTGDSLDSFEVIQRWSALSPDHLKTAMKAFDAQLARAHELRMTEAQLQDAKARREHTLFMTSMVLGFVVIIGLMSGAVLLAMQGQTILPTIFTTLSVSMATVFVLRKHDPTQMRAVVEAQARIARSRSVLSSPTDSRSPADAAIAVEGGTLDSSALG